MIKISLLLICVLLTNGNISGMMTTDQLTDQLHCAINRLSYQDTVHFLCEGADKSKVVNGCTALQLLNRQDAGSDHLEFLYREREELFNDCYWALENIPEGAVRLFEAISANNREEVEKSYTEFPEDLQLGVIEGVDLKHDTALHRAIRLGQAGDGLARLLVRKRGWIFSNETINRQNDGGDTPLHLVMKGANGRSKESTRRMCLLLVSRGADAGIKNNEDFSPMGYDPHFWTALFSSAPAHSFNPSFLSKIIALIGVLLPSYEFSGQADNQELWHWAVR